MKHLFKQMDESSVAKLRSAENSLGDGIKLIALEKRPGLSSIKSRPPGFQDLERDLDATLLVFFGSENLWRQRD